MEKKLTRSRRSKVIGGVCGGLAQYFNIDPIIIRVLFVVLTIAHGIGILFYIILWIVVPEEPFEMAYQVPNFENPSEPTTGPTFDPNAIPNVKTGSDTGRLVAGIILVGIGLVFLADRLIPTFDFEDVFPFILVVVGAALLVNSFKK